jgi:hypothetical protein
MVGTMSGGREKTPKGQDGTYIKLILALEREVEIWLKKFERILIRMRRCLPDSS